MRSSPLTVIHLAVAQKTVRTSQKGSSIQQTALGNHRLLATLPLPLCSPLGGSDYQANCIKWRREKSGSMVIRGRNMSGDMLWARSNIACGEFLAQKGNRWRSRLRLRHLDLADSTKKESRLSCCSSI